MDNLLPQLLQFVGEYWPQTLATAVAVFGVSWAITIVKKYFKKLELLERIDLKRRGFDEKVKRMTRMLTDNSTNELITPERQEILDLEIMDLSQRLRSGDLDPLDVLHAYWAKAILSTQKTNCIVDFIEESQDVAITLRNIPIEKRGPLFGIPISVKECLFVKV